VEKITRNKRKRFQRAGQVVLPTLLVLLNSCTALAPRKVLLRQTILVGAIGITFYFKKKSLDKEVKIQKNI
jgi:hypothetical protein